MSKDAECNQPTREDIERAESMMSAEEREAFSVRAEFYEQETPPWEDFSIHINEHDERRTPTKTEREKKKRIKLGIILKSCGRS